MTSAGPQRGARVAAAGVADRRDDAGPGGRAELHRGGADASRGPVHEERFAGLQAALAEDRVVGGHECLGEAAGLRPAERIGHRHELALVQHGQLGLAGARHDRHDPFAGAEAVGVAAHPGDFPGQLEAGDVRGNAGPWRRRVEAEHLHLIGAIQPGRAHADQDLARAGCRIRMLGDDDPPVADGGSAHGLLRSRVARPAPRRAG